MISLALQRHCCAPAIRVDLIPSSSDYSPPAFLSLRHSILQWVPYTPVRFVLIPVSVEMCNDSLSMGESELKTVGSSSLGEVKEGRIQICGVLIK